MFAGDVSQKDHSWRERVRPATARTSFISDQQHGVQVRGQEEQISSLRRELDEVRETAKRELRRELAELREVASTQVLLGIEGVAQAQTDQSEQLTRQFKQQRADYKHTMREELQVRAEADS